MDKQEETKSNAMLSELQAQRNQAMDNLVIANSIVAILREEIKELKEKLPKEEESKE